MRNKDTQPVSIVGISGSLRKAFFSTEILRVLAEESKPPIHFHLVTLEEIPVYNEGLKTATRVPAVNALKRLISSCDSVLISTPEYNPRHSGRFEECPGLGFAPGLRNFVDESYRTRPDSLSC